MCSVQSLSHVDSLQTHGLQHARPPCPSPTPRVYSNSCPLSRWCLPNASSSVMPFSSRLQSFPASGFFLMSQFFASGDQNSGAWAAASVLPMNFQDWFPLELDWLDLLAIQGDVNVKKASILLYSAFFIVQLSHPYATTGKTTALTIWTFVGKVMSLLF